MIAHDLISVHDLIAAKGSRLGVPLELLDETSSTNDVAKRAAKLGAPHGATWLAEEQTAGRGRHGREWVGVRGESLLFSVLLRVLCLPARLPLVALAAGLAVRDVVSAAAPSASVGVKWPNDVVSGEEKVAGILVEALPPVDAQTPVVIGIGLNVHTRAFPPELRATSIALLGSARPPDRAALLAEILAGLDRDVALVANRGLGVIHGRLSSADALRGRTVRTDEGATGIADGIDLEGRLRVVEKGGSLLRLVAGEVHLV